MQKLKQIFSNKKAVIRIAAALLLVVAITAGFGISAKYRREMNFKGTLVIKAGLAGRLTTVAHKVNQNSDGSYSPNPSETTDSLNYQLMPGVNVPFDPVVKIEKKTSVPAFLYIEVVSTLPATVNYMLDVSSWTPLGVVGPNRGTVYAYKTTITGDGNTDISVPVLDQSAEVLTVDSAYAETLTQSLAIYPYMKAEGSFTDAKACFEDTAASPVAGAELTVEATPRASTGSSAIGSVDDKTGAVTIGTIDYTVYVRAAVIVNLQDNVGNIVAQMPVENTDYEFTSGSGWFKAADGFYYYEAPLASGESTTALTDQFKTLGTIPSGYELVLTVHAQTIQSAGSAVTVEWGCTVGTDGKISK